MLNRKSKRDVNREREREREIVSHTSLGVTNWQVFLIIMTRIPSLSRQGGREFKEQRPSCRRILNVWRVVSPKKLLFVPSLPFLISHLSRPPPAHSSGL